MSDLLNIGSSGLRAYRAALQAVSSNVTNANSEGYSRRKVQLAESAVSTGTSILYRPQVNFGGVDVAGVTRSWDQFKAADARLSGSEFGETDAKLRWLQQIETGLDDGNAGVGSRMTAVFTTADELASDPNGDFPRRAFLNAIDEAAGAFRQTADDLSLTANNIESKASAEVDIINSDLATLAKLNVQIKKAGVGTETYAQVSDERDKLLDEIASKVGIDVTFDSVGAVRITLAGDGGVLLQDATPSLLGMQRASDGRLGFLMSNNVSGSAGFNPVGGSLAGLQDVSAQLAGRRAELDSMASDFATLLNDWSAAGFDANGNAGQPLLSITAGAATLTAVATDPDLVPAASSTSDFGNLLALGTSRTSSGIEDRWVALVAGNAQQVSSAKTNVEVTTARRDIAYAARDAVAGVDLDAEAADLIRYQQAYSACAHVIQVARDTMNDVLNLF